MTANKWLRLATLSVLAGAFAQLSIVIFQLNQAAVPGIVFAHLFHPSTDQIRAFAWVQIFPGGCFTLALASLLSAVSNRIGPLGTFGLFIAIGGMMTVIAAEVGFILAIPSGCYPRLLCDPFVSSTIGELTVLKEGGLAGTILVVAGLLVFSRAAIQIHLFPRWNAVLILVSCLSIYSYAALPHPIESPEWYFVKVSVPTILLGLAWALGWLALATAVRSLAYGQTRFIIMLMRGEVE